MSTRRPSSRAAPSITTPSWREPAARRTGTPRATASSSHCASSTTASTGRSSAARASSDSSAAGTVKRSVGCGRAERERTADRRRLHAGQLVEVGEQRRDELGEARERDVGLGLHPARLEHREVVRLVDRALQQRGLADPGRAVQQQRAAAPFARGVEERGQAGSLVRAADHLCAESMAWRDARPACRVAAVTAAGKGVVARGVVESVAGLAALTVDQTRPRTGPWSGWHALTAAQRTRHAAWSTTSLTCCSNRQPRYVVGSRGSADGSNPSSRSRADDAARSPSDPAIQATASRGATSRSVTSPWRFASRRPSGPEHQRHVRVRRRRHAQRASQPDLPRRRVDEVGAAHDLLDALRRVVDDDREVVGVRAVVALHDEVVDDAGLRPQHPVVEVHARRAGVHPQRGHAPRRAALPRARRRTARGTCPDTRPRAAARAPPTRSRGSRRACRSTRRPAAATAPPRTARPRSDCTTTSPSQSSPIAARSVELRLGEPRPHAPRVEILDPHQEPDARRAREQPREQRGAQVAEVQDARRRGCEAAVLHTVNGSDVSDLRQPRRRGVALRIEQLDVGRPLDPDVGIVEADARLGRRVVVVRALVDEVRDLAHAPGSRARSRPGSTASARRRRPELDALPLAERRRAAAQVHDHVPDAAPRHADELALPGMRLEVDAAQRPAARARVVVLDELGRECRAAARRPRGTSPRRSRVRRRAPSVPAARGRRVWSQAVALREEVRERPSKDRLAMPRTATMPPAARGHQTLSTYISARFDEFSRSQKDVAQYVVDHLDEVAFHTAEELARRANTSSSTVVRFSQALGFEGFPELQEAAREEYRHHHRSARAPELATPLFSLDHVAVRAGRRRRPRQRRGHGAARVAAPRSTARSRRSPPPSGS